jgi:hypothetical protein
MLHASSLCWWFPTLALIPDCYTSTSPLGLLSTICYTFAFAVRILAISSFRARFVKVLRLISNTVGSQLSRQNRDREKLGRESLTLIVLGDKRLG